MVVLDPHGHVLLLRYDDPPPLGTHWLTPGGGINDGETARDAAAELPSYLIKIFAELGGS